MADCSIGDRVQVRWQDHSFDGVVIHVHASGKADVVYDIDGSVGVFLTAKEHGLKVLTLPTEEKGVEAPAEGGRKKKEKVCSAESCPYKPHAKGLCKIHGGKPCAIDGCATKAVARGLCDKHGGGGGKGKVCSVGGCLQKVCARAGGLCAHHCSKLCSIDGCTTKARARGLCYKHGVLGECLREGCTTPIRNKVRLCSKHKPCSTKGCTTIARARGVCNKHGAKKICSSKNCTTPAAARGRCCKHGGGSKRVCKEEGCATAAVKRGICVKHGAYGRCKFEGCTTSAHAGSSHCVRHGGGKKPCSVASCTIVSRRKGLCSKHGGGNDECAFEGCTNQQAGTRRKSCKRHGGLGYCAYSSECSTPALKLGGNCQKHTSSN